MDVYIPLSHNLARAKDPSELPDPLFSVVCLCRVCVCMCVCSEGKRQSLVKHGRIDIVQCLRDLPPTKNHLSSFNVDVMRATVIPLQVLCHTYNPEPCLCFSAANKHGFHYIWFL